MPYIRSDDLSTDEDISIDERFEATLVSAMSDVDGCITAVSLSRIKSESSSDESIQELVRLVLNGFPNSKDELTDKLKPYWNVREHLSVLDNFLLYKN